MFIKRLTLYQAYMCEYTYEVCPEGTQPCNMKKRPLLKKIQDTRNIVHRTVTPQSSTKQAPWDLTQFSQLPSAALLYFPESHQQSEISFLSKVIFSLGKSKKSQGTKSGLQGMLSHLSDLMFRQKKPLHNVRCMSRHVVMMKPQITSCPQLWSSESSEQSPHRNIQA